jgi:hypothetical protein
MAQVVFDLDKGLCLEDTGTLLAWHTPLAQLRDWGRPDVCAVSPGAPPVTVLFWRQRLCLRGLKCHVSVAFGAGQYSVSALRGLRLVPVFDCDVGSLESAFVWSQARLVQRFGEPLGCAHEPGGGAALWRFGGVVLRHEFYDALLWGEDRLLLYLE